MVPVISIVIVHCSFAIEQSMQTLTVPFTGPDVVLTTTHFLKATAPPPRRGCSKITVDNGWRFRGFDSFAEVESTLVSRRLCGAGVLACRASSPMVMPREITK